MEVKVFFGEHIDFWRKKGQTGSKPPIFENLIFNLKLIFFYVYRQILVSLKVCRNKKNLRITEIDNE